MIQSIYMEVYEQAQIKLFYKNDSILILKQCKNLLIGKQSIDIPALAYVNYTILEMNLYNTK